MISVSRKLSRDNSDCESNTSNPFLPKPMMANKAIQRQPLTHLTECGHKYSMTFKILRELYHRHSIILIIVNSNILLNTK
jgi:hypothetical protein